MSTDDIKRRMVWHGVLIFILGLLSGAVAPVLENPRMGIAAHLGGVLDGMFLILLGLVWADLVLSKSAGKVAFRLLLFAGYSGWAAQLLAAALGTSRAMPIAGAGHVGTAWEENLVTLVAVSFALAILIGCIVVLYGLRGRREATL